MYFGGRPGSFNVSLFVPILFQGKNDLTVTLPCGVASYIPGPKRFQSHFNYAGVTYLFVTSSVLQSERERETERDTESETERERDLQL